MNNRRKLVIALGAGALTAPLRSFAQPKQAPVLIGWLNIGSREGNGYLLAAFREGMAALGWKEGSNFMLEARWANAQTDRLQVLAEELAAKNPALIVAGPTESVASAAKAAPKTPIVMASGNPLESGLVTSLARPAGMITGVSNGATEIAEKLLELLLAAVPTLRLVGFLFDPGVLKPERYRDAARRSIARSRVEARFADAARPEEIEPAIKKLAEEGAQALVVMSSVFFQSKPQPLIPLIKLALAHRWPVIASLRTFAEEGALLSYGADRSALYSRAAYYVDRILKGVKPADLPIELPTKFEFVVNMKTAKALGIKISNSTLVRATAVIE